MRSDGYFKFYRIQHKTKGTGEWVFSSLDHFGMPLGFNASGDCWQKTGFHGTFDVHQGRTGLDWIRLRNVGYTFRLVMVEITQRTLPMHG